MKMMEATRKRQIVRPTAIEEPLATHEAAALLGVSAWTMRRWRMQKVGPVFTRTGYRSCWYAKADVEAFVATINQKGWHAALWHSENT